MNDGSKNGSLLYEMGIDKHKTSKENDEKAPLLD
jgi:hypothetical protein